MERFLAHPDTSGLPGQRIQSICCNDQPGRYSLSVIRLYMDLV